MNIPDGMKEVSKEDFFEHLKADKRDIMPSTMAENYSWWKVVSSQQIWGWTWPGWKNSGEGEKRYAIITGK
jgi:hypothetical protein